MNIWPQICSVSFPFSYFRNFLLWGAESIKYAKPDIILRVYHYSFESCRIFESFWIIHTEEIENAWYSRYNIKRYNMEKRRIPIFIYMYKIIPFYCDELLDQIIGLQWLCFLNKNHNLNKNDFYISREVNTISLPIRWAWKWETIEEFFKIMASYNSLLNVFHSVIEAINK